MLYSKRNVTSVGAQINIILSITKQRMVFLKVSRRIKDALCAMAEEKPEHTETKFRKTEKPNRAAHGWSDLCGMMVDTGLVTWWNME